MHLHDHKKALYIASAVIEGSGVVVLWSMDIGPAIVGEWRRTRAKLASLRRRVAALVRRVTRRPRNVTINVPVAVATATALRAQVIRGVEGQTLDAQVRSLIEHDRATQERLNVLDGQVEDAAAAHERELTQLRDDLEAHAIRAALNAVDHGRRRRQIGTGLVAVGIFVGTLGNLA